MATLKHINSKNADYGAAEQYLLFEHDEFTMKPVLDETGRLIPREDYRLSTLNCGGEDFAVACMRSNLRYGKNQRREDVKSHHYIISFDPRDAADNGLTVDRAQALGEKFCTEHFPGHQALVCAHPDGHNHSGNICQPQQQLLAISFLRLWAFTVKEAFMAISKSAKIEAEIEKVKAKITEQQARLKDLEQKKVEAENSEIVDIVRGMSIPLAELPVVLQQIRAGATLGQNVPKSETEDKEDTE